MPGDRKYAIIVFGATGDAGSACAYHTVKNAGCLKVALAGRNRERVTATRDDICNRLQVPKTSFDVVIADALQPETMLAMCQSTTILLACAGPFARHGEAAVAACVKAGTHYLDITGEIPWVNKMRLRYEEEAIAKSVALMSFAGYDCVPAELALYLIYKQCKSANTNLVSLETVMATRGGGFPKGTIRTLLDGADKATGFQTAEASVSNIVMNEDSRKNVESKERDPFVPAQFKTQAAAAVGPMRWIFPSFSSQITQFVAQNFMSVVNVPAVYRAASIFGVDSDFSFRDRFVVLGDHFVDPLARKRATGTLRDFMTLWGFIPCIVYSLGTAAGALLVLLPPVRMLIRWVLAKTKYEFRGNVKGQINLLAKGVGHDGNAYDARVTCEGDPGIYATGALIAANAYALLDSLSNGHEVRYGFNSPVVALHKSPKYLKILGECGIETAAGAEVSGVTKSSL